MTTIIQKICKFTTTKIQKLADLSDYTEKEREDVFYRPIRRLLKHSDEKVRAMAQETLDKITPDINKK